ncbi:MAG: AhpC/TSA family protein [Bacteroidales bacterium]|nr:AhpC/TSA family protein [Bacteroidales bacterium]
MKKILLLAFVVLFVTSCNNTQNAKINATITDAKDVKVVLQKLNYSTMSVIDTITTDSAGKFKYKVKLPNSSPNFYYLYINDTKVASMILLPKDNVTIVADGKGSYTIEGSLESSNLEKIDNTFYAAIAKMDSLTKESQTISSDNKDQVQSLNRQRGQVYVQQKRAAIRHIMENPNSITSAVVLFQRFGENLPVFGEMSDVILFKRVYDSLQVVYPESEFMIALMDEINVREKMFEFENKLSSVSEISFPDLVLPDMNGNQSILSSLTGKVIILSFWSVAQTEHKMFNNELKELYSSYKDKGLEIYQVALDVDKPTWASAVQNLPWINVNDGLGTASPSITAYNIKKIPSNFIIDRKGDIIARDIFEISKMKEIIKKAL